MSTDQPITLITGASRGIGAGMAKRFAEAGHHVLVNYSSNEAKAQAVADEIIAAGGSAELCGFNVADSAQVDEKFTWIKKTHGRLDCLVNNAGITIDALLLRLKDEDLERTLDIDLKGAIYCTRAAAKLMMKARSGSIVQISSVVGESGSPGQSAYAAAKAGLIGFTKSAAKELASRGICVNVITPGFIRTDMTDALNDDQKSAYLGQIPVARFGEAEDVADLALFLASSRSRYITGQVIGVNGGLYM